MRGSPGGSVKRVPRWEAAALVLGSILLCLILGEIGIRIVHPSASLWRYPNYIEVATRPDPDQPVALLQYDAELGYEPRPNASGVLMHQPVSYSSDGLRNHNLDQRPPPRPVILAVGDSYTEGYGVKDDETWPAHLERDSGIRVLNAGVRGYGLDQIVLRAERLAARYQPQAMVLAFIAVDVGRSGLSVRESVHKPYFAPTPNGLEVRNVPMPTTSITGPKAFLRRVLGHSYLLDFAMRRLGAFQLWYGADRDAGIDARLVSCRLMERFAAVLRKYTAKGLVVALPEYDVWTSASAGREHRSTTTAVLRCAEHAGIPVLDLHDAFAAAGAARDPHLLYVDWHFNDRGNALAARLIDEALRGER